MGFRFRRTIRLAPGLRINLAKTGASLSVGRPGATVNVGKQGTRTTVGLPGTGLSWRSSSSRRSAGSGGIGSFVSGLGVLLLVGAIAWHLIFG